MTRITIPQLDANLVDITLTRWIKRPGETVTAGESLAELTTDKAVYELESPASGLLLEIYAADKSIVPIGFIVGLIGNQGESDPSVADENARITAVYRGDEAELVAEHPPRNRETRIRATPRARRLAHERGIDLSLVQTETGAAIIDEATLAPYLKST